MLGYVVVLDPATVPRDLWLRMRTTSTHKLLVQAMPLKDLPEANVRAIVWTSLYAAVLLLILLVLLVVWWGHREAVLGGYLIRHVNYMFYGVSYLGLTDVLLHDNIPPDFLDQGFSLSVILTLPLGLWFDMSMLKTYRSNPLLLKLLRLMGWSSLGMLAMFLAGHTRLALAYTVQHMLVASILIFAAAWSSQPEPEVQWLLCINMQVV